ncbi:MAG TPA: hypothetical protein VK545_09950 [Streptomyces sp.]|nr:hypothetical protein [Streptomyces sp.]
MPLSIGTVHALAVLEEGTPKFTPRMGDGTILVAREVTTLLVALTEEVARLERRVKELEERP